MPRRERPLDAGESELLQFAADLRRLRELAGSPTYRELSKRAHYSAAALSEAAGGRKLPSLAVTIAYVQACEGDAQEWERRWRNTLVHNGHGDGQSPYVGLKPFQASDADRFFGRDRLTSELLDLVAQKRFIGVFGASGVGKSSVLRAGLIARTDLPVLLFTPGADPLEECAIQLAAQRDESVVDIRTALEDPKNLTELADGLLVVVDQFEELFTLCRVEQQREWLITALTHGPHVVIGVRADFYGHCARYPGLVDALRGGQVMVGAMSADELRQAVVEPAAHAGAKVETALLARLMSDAAGQPAVLPLLSHALAETWERRDGMTLTLHGYEQAGGLEYAVAHTAQTVYTGFDTAQRKQAREILLRLIAVGEDTEDTKRRVRRSELGDGGEVLDRLVAARLLTLDGDGVELAHEALIRSWPLLRQWIEQDREGLRVHRTLTDAADAWESLERDPGALYRGVRLELAREWHAHSHTELNERERAFLDASEAADAEVAAAARRRTRRGRQLIAVLLVLLVVAVSATVYALRAQQTATEERNKALALKAVGEATALRANNPALALQVNLAAYELAKLPEARSGLRYEAFTGQILRNAGSEVTAMVLSPTQQLLVSGHRDGTVLTTDLRDQPGTRASVPATKHNSAVVAMAISPDGRTVVSADAGGVVRIVDIALGKPSEIGTFQAHAAAVTALAFRGDTLVTAGQDNAVKVWEGVPNATQKLVATSTDVVPKLRHLAFAPDGATIAAVTLGGDLLMVDVRADWTLHVRATRPRVGTTVSFSDTGSLLATASGKGANLWSTAKPEQLATVAGDGGQVYAALLSREGNTLATANEDGSTRLWTITDPRQPVETARLIGHTGPVTAVALMPLADTVITGGADGTLRLWKLDGRDRLDRVCERAVPRMTADEWRHFFPGLDFQPPCPPL
ncbi:XRE family transcriptional regulator [Lentzea sp. NBRC 105346]|uniref:nSTAND1 domain-containing NTPase n=1 Tax=Lentzea sp. NBRC 105346 TaxID=3032205 RepID=UPI002555C28D|nr:XRE family transcriptional regulator [Lentzea sp. NBRC 105346]